MGDKKLLHVLFNETKLGYAERFLQVVMMFLSVWPVVYIKFKANEVMNNELIFTVTILNK
ncbi:hypothetical protein AAKU64_002965 [Undibacterium sp. GrIS 1.8]